MSAAIISLRWISGRKSHRWIVALTSTISFVSVSWWLLSFPPSISSDDALFFATAITRFSILDYSPHFPGYPGFVALGRLVNLAVGDSIRALMLTSTLTALLIPVALALTAWRWTRSALPALFCLALGATLPLLPQLAISGLSDGTGLLFFLLFFASQPETAAFCKRQRLNDYWWMVAGLFLGLSVCARPSNTAILLAACIPFACVRPRAAVLVSVGTLCVVIPALLFILAVEGSNYFIEGQRFLEGHLFNWGNTVFSRSNSPTWIGTFSDYPAVLLLFIIMTITTAIAAFHLTWTVRTLSLCASLIAAALWALIMQNPENLRHLAPFLVLGILLVAVLSVEISFGRAIIYLMFLLNIFILVQKNTLAPRISPLAAAAKGINDDYGEAILFTHHGVQYFRDSLDHVRVYDLGSPASALAALSSAPETLLRITNTHIKPCTAKHVHLPGRFLGDPDFWLIRTRSSERFAGCKGALADLSE